MHRDFFVLNKKSNLVLIESMSCIKFIRSNLNIFSTNLDTGYSYRSGTVNSNTVNSKFHLIRSFCEIFARFLLFHV